MKEDAHRDKLTGLMDRQTFLDQLETILQNDQPPRGGIVYFDVQHFKLINNRLGVSEGDRLLCYIAEQTHQAARPHDLACHFDSDRFAFYAAVEKSELEYRIEVLFDKIAAFSPSFEILCNAGIYLLDANPISANMAVDYAIMAQNKVKGSFSQRFHYYDETLWQHLFGELEIVGSMREALHHKQFAVFYQPQYNHITGRLVGAEALVRWQHPEKGLISPEQFIPVFENNGFISQLDRYVFEQVCIFLKNCLTQQIALIPISVNLARCDLFTPGFLEQLEVIRQNYGIPAKYIHLEITESSILGNNSLINSTLTKLHQYGYIVEMDDFGSGYSSLNLLKDIDFDIIKLDTRFFQDKEGHKGRGGAILRGVIHMLNLLQLPVIAEGVETAEQANFLQSIGCHLIQGYLYAKLLPEPEFIALLCDNDADA